MFAKSWMKWAAVAAVPAMALAAMPVASQARTHSHYAAMSVTPPKAVVRTASHKKAKAFAVSHKKAKGLAVTHKKLAVHHKLTKSGKHTASKLSKVHKTTM